MTMDKKEYEVVSTAINEERPDLSRAAGHFNFLSNMAAFNIVFSYMKVFKYLQIFPSLAVLWRTLKLAAIDTWPFLFVFILFTCGFSFAGHWMFGLTMIEFHSWPRSFVTLFLTMVGGYPYDDMKRVAPFSGAIFTVVWVLVMVMVVANMFVAILTESYSRVEEENALEDKRLKAAVCATKKGRPFNMILNQLGLAFGKKSWSGVRPLGGLRGGAKAATDEEELIKLLKKADLRSTDYVRQALLGHESLVTENIARHWGGDIRETSNFVDKLRRLADEESSKQDNNAIFQSQDEIENEEQEQLRKLQTTVQRLEGHLSHLRTALHESGVATVPAGQLQQGYCMEDPGPAASRGRPEEAVDASLPGAVPVHP